MLQYRQWQEHRAAEQARRHADLVAEQERLLGASAAFMQRERAAAAAPPSDASADARQQQQQQQRQFLQWTKRPGVLEEGLPTIPRISDAVSAAAAAASASRAPPLWAALQLAAWAGEAADRWPLRTLGLSDVAAAATPAAASMARARYFALARLLHPDRWAVTWRAGASSVPDWAAAWPEEVVQAAAAAAFTRINAAYHALEQQQQQQWRR